MPRPFHHFVPWIAIALAVCLAMVYFYSQAKQAPETFEGCVARLSRADDTEDTRSLNRAACGNKPRAVEAAEGAIAQ